jgi:twitching motility protein PilT
MLQSFPETDKEFFRTLLVQSMLGVVSQVLVPAQAGGRVAVYELLRNTLAVANQISAGKPNMLRGEMQTGFVQGTMQTRDQHLLQLFKNRTITEASALEWALDRSEIASQIRRIISR